MSPTPPCPIECSVSMPLQGQGDEVVVMGKITASNWFQKNKTFRGRSNECKKTTETGTGGWVAYIDEFYHLCSPGLTVALKIVTGNFCGTRLHNATNTF